mmetsp:Transcript_20429/g.42654  ORF Transcript_20429/g.42654 Transcript_20429/m.42654 type:complete len:188 (+) Transcript_20429:206-769(+)
MSPKRVLYHPLNHIWLRAKEPITKQPVAAAAVASKPYRILQIGLTERGIEDVGDITAVRKPAGFFSYHKNRGKNQDDPRINRGDELLQIHFDGHSITSADELYHTVWETFSDHLSIRSPVSGSIPQTESDIDATLKSIELDGIDEETVLMDIEITEGEWESVHRQNQFVDGPSYSQMIEGQPRGAFY